MTTIRPARAEDLPLLQEVERAAGAPFRALGMDAVADDEPLPIEHLAEYQRAGRTWVAEDHGDVVGYLLVDVVDAPPTSSRSPSTPPTPAGASAERSSRPPWRGPASTRCPP